MLVHNVLTFIIKETLMRNINYSIHTKLWFEELPVKTKNEVQKIVKNIIDYKDNNIEILDIDIVTDLDAKLKVFWLNWGKPTKVFFTTDYDLDNLLYNQEATITDPMFLIYFKEYVKSETICKTKEF